MKSFTKIVCVVSDAAQTTITVVLVLAWIAVVSLPFYIVLHFVLKYW
jgi:hypothetical protein